MILRSHWELRQEVSEVTVLPLLAAVAPYIMYYSGHRLGLTIICSPERRAARQLKVPHGATSMVVRLAAIPGGPNRNGVPIVLGEIGRAHV